MTKEKKKNLLRIRPIHGNYFFCDTSDEACEKFGFKHGDRVVTPSGHKATIMGVAFTGAPGLDVYNNIKVLWFISDVFEGACYWSSDPDETYLPDQRFRKIKKK